MPHPIEFGFEAGRRPGRLYVAGPTFIFREAERQMPPAGSSLSVSLNSVFSKESLYGGSFQQWLLKDLAFRRMVPPVKKVATETTLGFISQFVGLSKTPEPSQETQTPKLEVITFEPVETGFRLEARVPKPSAGEATLKQVVSRRVGSLAYSVAAFGYHVSQTDCEARLHDSTHYDDEGISLTFSHRSQLYSNGDFHNTDQPTFTLGGEVEGGSHPLVALAGTVAIAEAARPEGQA